MFYKWLIVIPLLIGYLSNAQTSSIDSLLFKVKNNQLTEETANQAIKLPYHQIVNNLNKSYSLYNSLYQSNVFLKNNQKQAELIEQMALVSYLKGKYQESFELHKKSIKLFELTNDKRKMAMAMASMAYEGKKRNLNGSISLMREAIQILKVNNITDGLPAVIDNYGVLFELKGDLDSALYFYNSALHLKRTTSDSLGIPYSLNNIAGIYFMQGKYKEGLKIMEESNAIRKSLKDYMGLIWNEFSMGEMYINKNNYSDAAPHIRTSLKYSIDYSYPDLIARNAKYLASILSQYKKFDSAYYYFNMFHELNDSIYNANKQNQLLEMESIYESDKKSFQIKALNDENILKQNEIEKKRNSLYFFIILSFILIFAGVFIYRAYNQKNKANIIIQEQKNEVEKQKQIIEEKQKEILDSIQYAKRIQYTLLAHDSLLKENLREKENHQSFTNDYFVLFKPKDIVSGDFYWATKHANHFYLAVCDSTGHGVPGAFMSLLNISFLNEAISEKGIHQPNEVLNYVRNRLIESISKDGAQDGMDGILLRLANENGVISIDYAAANNPPILLCSNTLTSLPYDKMPIGKSIKTDNFVNYKINTSAGDMLYLYTDGYADQFGGLKGKKFKYKQLNELLLANADKPVDIQKQLLTKVFDDWKGNLEQVDDVCIIGLRV